MQASERIEVFYCKSPYQTTASGREHLEPRNLENDKSDQLRRKIYVRPPDLQRPIKDPNNNNPQIWQRPHSKRKIE